MVEMTRVSRASSLDLDLDGDTWDWTVDLGYSDLWPRWERLDWRGWMGKISSSSSR